MSSAPGQAHWDLLAAVPWQPGQRITFERDASDSYRLELGPGVEGSVPTRVERTDVMGILPAGSRWQAASGWRSFVGSPVGRAPDYAVGLEVVLDHETRGAYPAFRGFVFAGGPPIEGLLALAQLIAPASPAAGAPDGSAYGVIWSDSPSLASHRALEANTLRLAAAALRRDPGFSFRTVLLSEDQVPRPWHKHLLRQRFLLGSVTPISSTFSRPSRLFLQTCRYVL